MDPTMAPQMESVNWSGENATRRGYHQAVHQGWQYCFDNKIENWKSFGVSFGARFSGPILGLSTVVAIKVVPKFRASFKGPQKNK